MCASETSLEMNSFNENVCLVQTFVFTAKQLSPKKVKVTYESIFIKLMQSE